MKKGDKIDFYLFGTPETGVVEKVNRKAKTVNIAHGGVIYPNVETLFIGWPGIKEMRSKKPWYILKK